MICRIHLLLNWVLPISIYQNQQNIIMDIHFGQDFNLITECQTECTQIQNSDQEKLRLIEQNRMKEKALDKASALIDLLNVQLAVSKKAFEEALKEINQEIVSKEAHEIKLKEQIKNLQQRNNFLELECKKRLNETKINRSTSKSSFKSFSRTPSEQNLKSINKMKRTDSSSRVTFTPQKKKQQDFTIEYVKTFLQEYLQQDFQQNNFIQNLIQRENMICNNLSTKIQNIKPQLVCIETLRGGISDSLQNDIEQTTRQLKEMIQDQKRIIQKYRGINEQYRQIIHELMNKILNKNQAFLEQDQILSVLKNMNSIFPSKSRQVKDRILMSPNTNKQKKKNQLSVQGEQLLQYKNLVQQIKAAIGIQTASSEQDLLARIRIKSNNQKRLIEENRQLVSITQGLLKYIRY